MSINLANTYTALVVLKILGDDLSRVDKKSLSGAIHELQTEEGSYLFRMLFSFQCTFFFSFTSAGPIGSAECDMRFVYSACAISALINDWSGVDIVLSSFFFIFIISFNSLSSRKVLKNLFFHANRTIMGSAQTQTPSHTVC
jgi:prenyltransferase beta subunit